MASKREEVYNSLFDLIFSDGKSKGGVPLEGVDTSGLSGVGKGLAEMAAYPFAYPASQLVSDFTFQGNLATAVKAEPLPDMKLEVGATSALNTFLAPKSFFDKAWADYKEAKKLSQFSARLRYIDGAKFAAMAKKLGLSWKDAVDLGFTVQDTTGTTPSDVFKGKSRSDLRDLSARRINQKWFNTSVDSITANEGGVGLGSSHGFDGSIGVLNRGLSAEFETAIKRFENINNLSLPGDVKKNIKREFSTYVKNTVSYSDKLSRRQHFKQLLDGYSFTIGGNTYRFSDSIKADLTSGIWGVNEVDQNVLRSYYQGLPRNQQDQLVERQRKFQEGDLGYYSFFETQKVDEDPTARLRYANTRSQLRKLNAFIQGETDPNLKRELIAYRDEFYKFISGQKIKFANSLGTSIGRISYLNKWRKDHLKSGRLFGAALTGTLFDYKNSLWRSGFMDVFLKKYKTKLRADGHEFAWGFAEGKDNAIGKIVNSYYYLHPINVAKGLFWDGRFYKWLHDKRFIGFRDAEKVENFIKFMPGQFLAKRSKKIQKLLADRFNIAVSAPFKGILALIAKKSLTQYSGMATKEIMKVPIKKLLTQIITKVITQIFGSTIPIVGNVAAFIADIAIKIGWNLMEKVLKPLLELILILSLGVISIMIIAGGGFLSFVGERFTQPYLANPVLSTSGHLVYGPVDYQFPNYSTGDINCNQNLPDQEIEGVMSKEEFGKLADRWTGGTNYADECYNDVICRALSNGVDPAFALLIWVHESGASNYDSSSLPVQDFGINDGSTPAEDFNAQINQFMALSHNYSCPGLSYWESWATRYLTGTCDPDKVVNGITGPEYLNGWDDNPGISDIYGWIRGGSGLPSKIKDPSQATGQDCDSVGYNPTLPLYSGGSLEFGGEVLSGSAKEIWDQVIAEFGVSSRLILVSRGHPTYTYLDSQGAWCISQSGVIQCLSDKIYGASDAMLTGLFRHEVTHHVQQSNGSLSNWPTQIREWGAEHLSNNGGHYMFGTSDGYCMRGMQVSQKLLDSGECTNAELDEIAKGNKPSNSCSSYVSGYITGASIGSSCN